MYETHFGFTQKPFQMVPDPGYLYLGKGYRHALTCLEYGLNERAGYILLTGDVGVGKTTLIHHVLGKVKSKMAISLVHNTNVTAEQFLRLVLAGFRVAVKDASKTELLAILRRFLIKARQQDRQTLLMIDEAQNLSDEALEEVRLLSNLQDTRHMLLPVLLAGQPELKRRLSRPDLAQFAQRIAVNYHLGPLDAAETAAYIACRLERAGGRPDIFAPEAVQKIFTHTGGVPRLINLLCDTALVYAMADDDRFVGPQIVQNVVRDRDGFGFDGRAPAKTESALDAPQAPISLELARLQQELMKLKTYIRQKSGAEKQSREALALALKKRFAADSARYAKLLRENAALRKTLGELSRMLDPPSQGRGYRHVKIRAVH